MTSPHTPPRDLDDAVAAARGTPISDIFYRMEAARLAHERAERRKGLRRRLIRAALISTAAVAAIVLLTESASPETWQGDPMGSSVTLRPSTAPGAAAELFFDNRGADGGGRIIHMFTLGGHHIEAELGMSDPDTISVTPADGYIAVPDVLTIPDGQTGVVLLYRAEGVWM
jgi:hypothetical protein